MVHLSDITQNGSQNEDSAERKTCAEVCVGTLGWWFLGWGFAYGTQDGTKLFGSTGWAGDGFYTKDATTGLGWDTAIETGLLNISSIHFCLANPALLSIECCMHWTSPHY